MLPLAVASAAAALLSYSTAHSLGKAAGSLAGSLIGLNALSGDFADPQILCDPFVCQPAS